MKKITLLKSLLLIGLFASGQNYPTVNYYTTIYTRNSTPVEGTVYYPLSNSQYADAINFVHQSYPNATIQENPTSEYNCYSFAFHLSEGNTQKVWINPTTTNNTANLSNYWTDGSFIQVCNESESDKAYYYLGDHAAVTSSSISGQYESKWGANCRVIHAPTYCPYDVPLYRRQYYASTKISGGNDNLCTGTRTFTVKNISGATYTWTYSSSVSAVGATNTNQIIVQRNGSSNSAAWVEVQISTPCSGTSVTNRINFSVGAPLPPTITTLNFDNQCGTYMEAACNNPSGATGYIWNLNFGQVVQDLDGYASDYFYVSPLIANPQIGRSYYNYVSVQAKNICGASASSETRQFTVGPVPSTCSGGCCLLRLSPNPTSNALTVETIDNSEFTRLRIVDKMGQVKKQVNYAPSKKVILSVADLPADVYRIQAFIKNNWTTVSFIKQ